MANPLARVVMKKIVCDKGGAVRQRNAQVSQSMNLGSKEENLLLDIMNGSKKATTLESLGAKSKKSNSSSSQSKVMSTPSNAGKSAMGSLKTLDALCLGKSKTSASKNTAKSSYGAKNTSYGKQASPAKSGGVRGISIESLVSGNKESKNLETRTQNNSDHRGQSTKNSSGMMSLNQLAGDKPKSGSSSAGSNKGTSVKGTVIGNLNDYIPKVTLGSIGKKGSL